MITTILCVQENSNYYKIPGLDLWDKKRNAYNYTGSNPIITHAPCQQWSRLKHFANENKEEKELAMHCLKLVQQNGGIFEHPAGSSFFKHAGIKPTLSINQNWWGYKCKKTTYLYYSKIKPNAINLNFNAITHKIHQLDKTERSKMPLKFCQWLINHNLEIQTTVNTFNS